MVKEDALNELKKLLKGKTLESAEEPRNNLEMDSLQDIGKDKIEPLKEAIRELESLIESRTKLSKQVLTEAEAIKMDINNFISNTSSGRRIEDPAFLRDQLALKQKQVDVSELQLKEKIDCWKDVTNLKKELRERKKELKERESRIEMLNRIMEK
ncbi:hypothetical protein HYT26_04905 [Candidatus Pacearchaeota archaeon]|nr:hypothetical protein [Candidatus Pacearchaeota archaeon]